MIPCREAAKYFLAKVDEGDGCDMTHLKLQKLLYYAQGFCLAASGEPLFPETIEAWAHGPVVPELYSTYRAYGAAPIQPDPNFSPEDLPHAQRLLLDEIYEVYGQFSAWRLREMTHEDEPWKNHAENADTIPNDELLAYFKRRLVNGG